MCVSQQYHPFEGFFTRFQVPMHVAFRETKCKSRKHFASIPLTFRNVKPGLNEVVFIYFFRTANTYAIPTCPISPTTTQNHSAAPAEPRFNSRPRQLFRPFPKNNKTIRDSDQLFSFNHRQFSERFPLKRKTVRP